MRREALDAWARDCRRLLSAKQVAPNSPHQNADAGFASGQSLVLRGPLATSCVSSVGSLTKLQQRRSGDACSKTHAKTDDYTPQRKRACSLDDVRVTHFATADSWVHRRSPLPITPWWRPWVPIPSACEGCMLLSYKIIH